MRLPQVTSQGSRVPSSLSPHHPLRRGGLTARCLGTFLIYTPKLPNSNLSTSLQGPSCLVLPVYLCFTGAAAKSYSDPVSPDPAPLSILSFQETVLSPALPCGSLWPLFHQIHLLPSSPAGYRPPDLYQRLLGLLGSQPADLGKHRACSFIGNGQEFCLPHRPPSVSRCCRAQARHVCCVKKPCSLPSGPEAPCRLPQGPGLPSALGHPDSCPALRPHWTRPSARDGCSLVTLPQPCAGLVGP